MHSVLSWGWGFVAVALVVVGCGGGAVGAGTGTAGMPAEAAGAGGDGGDGGDDGALAGTSGQCFPCERYWICGGPVEEIDLKPEADGCFLSGLSGRNLLAPDGTITADGVVVGKADGTGARVHVAHPDGSQWLFCAGSGGCPRSP